MDRKQRIYIQWRKNQNSPFAFEREYNYAVAYINGIMKVEKAIKQKELEMKWNGSCPHCGYNYKSVDEVQFHNCGKIRIPFDPHVNIPYCIHKVHMEAYCSKCDDFNKKYDTKFNEKTKLDTPMNIKCHDCKINFVTMHDFQQHLCRMKKETKMTREEAIASWQRIMYPGEDNNRPNCKDRIWAEKAIRAYESLGLLNFEESKKEKTNRLFSVNEPGKGWDGPDKNAVNLATTIANYGTIRLEECPEGLVLWVANCIVWKSWEKYYQTGDNVTIINRTNKLTSCGKIT